jgi:hypothetical protein
MVRLRNVVMVFVLATGLAGCSFAHWSPNIAHWSPFHCDSCDDFPMPAYGPNYSMMPGSYTGPPTPGLSGGRSDASTPSAAEAAPAGTPIGAPAAAPTTPPSPPSP